MTKSLIINIDVPDLQKGIAFYRDGLGLRYTRTLFDGDVAEMIHDGAAQKIYLLENLPGTMAFSEAAQTRDYARHWTPVHIDFIVDDLPGAMAAALKAGARQEKDIDTFAWGTLAHMADPFGNGFCLIQFHKDGYGDNT